MAIDPKLVSIKTASELPTALPTSAGQFFFFEGNQMKKAPMTDIYDKITSPYLGIATTTTTPPATGSYWYKVDAPGTYTNFKNSSNASIVVSAEDLNRNEVFLEIKDKVAIKRLRPQIIATSTAKIVTWTATDYTSGSQVVHKGRIYEANAATFAGDVPGVSAKWVLIGGGSVDLEFDLSSKNPIANQSVAAIYNALQYFVPAIYETLPPQRIEHLATTSGILNNAGDVGSSQTGYYRLNIPTNNYKTLKYGLCTYSPGQETYIWGVRADGNKALLVNKSSDSNYTNNLLEGTVDISAFKFLNISFYKGRNSNQYIEIYAPEHYSSEFNALKNYIDAKEVLDELYIPINLKGMTYFYTNNFTLMTTTNGWQTSFPHLLPKNIRKIEYFGYVPQGSNLLPVWLEDEEGKKIKLIASTEVNDGVVNISPNILSLTTITSEDFDFSKYKYITGSSQISASTLENLRYIKIYYKRKNPQDKSHVIENGVKHEVPMNLIASQPYKAPFTQSDSVTVGDTIYGWICGTSQRYLNVFSINKNTGEVKITNVTAQLGWPKTILDEHNQYSISITDGGHIYVAGNCHGSKPYIAKSTNPFDVSTWTEENFTMVTDVTYVRFVKDTLGNLYTFYRRGGSGNGNTYFAKYDNTAKAWGTPILLIDAISESAGNPYLQTVCATKTGVIKLAFGFRQSQSRWDTMSGLYYLESTDFGATWKKSTGETYSLPVKKSTAERIFVVNSGNGYVNQSGACVDHDGNYHTVITQRNADGKTDFVRIYQNGTQWLSDVVFETGEIVTDGGLYNPKYLRPFVFCNHQNKIFLIYLKDSILYQKKLETGEVKVILNYHWGEFCYDQYEAIKTNKLMFRASGHDGINNNYPYIFEALIK